mmetsp:Transcript_14690/g.43721  ORF Transcript_14690/g.43721 Transcript_14690/m.43721 type:complete len:203 (+) Transcript_14690:3-611(+)
MSPYLPISPISPQRRAASWSGTRSGATEGATAAATAAETATATAGATTAAATAARVRATAASAGGSAAAAGTAIDGATEAPFPLAAAAAAAARHVPLLPSPPLLRRLQRCGGCRCCGDGRAAAPARFASRGEGRKGGRAGSPFGGIALEAWRPPAPVAYMEYTVAACAVESQSSVSAGPAPGHVLASRRERGNTCSPHLSGN